MRYIRSVVLVTVFSCSTDSNHRSEKAHQQPEPTSSPTIVEQGQSPAGLPAFCGEIKRPGDWQSAQVFYGGDGKLQYKEDGEKNRIVDFSYAGYHYGNEEAPVYPVVATLDPISGDNTQHIQNAIDSIGRSTPDARGIRGALLLKPGRYPILGSLNIPYSGMVLRGSGSGEDLTRDSIIFAQGDTPHQRTVIILGGGSKGAWKSSGPAVEVSDEWVQVGARQLTVKDSKAFKVGDRVQIRHPSTQAWIDALGGGGPVTEASWEPFSTDIVYNRQITGIQGQTLQLDAPIFNHLNRKLAISTVSKVGDLPQAVRESGIENLHIDIQTAGGEDENHAWNALGISGAEDSWVRGIRARHYGQAGIFTLHALRVTIDDVEASDGVGIRTGERFYNFNAAAFSQLILFKNCRAKDGRHNFISNGVQTTSGIVWYKCASEGDSASEGHRRWSQALLFDSISERGGAINLINRGDAGISHGWGAAHSVVWNYSGTSSVQKPPTAQNYFISPVGKQGPQKVLGPGLTGVVELKPGSLSPASLYEAQLCERLQR